MSKGGGKMYSLARRRAGLPSLVDDVVENVAEDEHCVIIPSTWAGREVSPATARKMAHSLMRAAREAEVASSAPCRMCQRRACKRFHVGQIREIEKRKWVVVRETKKAWRLEAQDDRSCVRYFRGDPGFVPMLGWDGAFLEQTGLL